MSQFLSRGKDTARRANQRNRTLSAAAAAALMAAAGNASAVGFEFGPFEGTIENLLTVGAAWRVQDRADHLIGKSNLNPGLCVSTNYTNFPSQPNNFQTASDANAPVTYPAFAAGAPPGPQIDNVCSTSSAPDNQLFVDAPGSFSPNGDNGNLNYDKGDIVSAGVKLNSEISFDINLPLLRSMSFYANPIYFFDADSHGFDETRTDTTFVRPNPPRNEGAHALQTTGLDINGYHATAYLPFIGDRELLLRVGRQGLNWGESTALFLNSINTINPPDARRARFPGFDLKELFQPVGMVVTSTDITPNLFLEAFYQYEWRPVIADPVGSFMSVSDIVGAGGEYALLSFSKQPEDPEDIYAPGNNQNDPLFVTGSGATTNDTFDITLNADYNGDGDTDVITVNNIGAASRTVLKRPVQDASDDGQYGFALKYFAEWLNNGTELSLYYANYHSRVPVVSAFAANPTCIDDQTTDAVTAIADCGGGMLNVDPTDPAAVAGGLVDLITDNVASGGAAQVPLTGEIVPAGSVQLLQEYPEDIEMYGFSFNTTVGDLAFSGEYSYRPNLPIQVQTTDLVYAALQPAFPNNTVAVPGVGNIGARRVAVPDQINSAFRGNQLRANDDPLFNGYSIDGTFNGQPNYYIPGFEREEIHQLQFTFLNTFGGANWLNASQIIAIFEFGGTWLPNIPDITELQFNASQTTHVTFGGDGTSNGAAFERVFADAPPPDGDSCFDEASGTPVPTCVQNPTAQPLDHQPTKFSWGFRALSLIRYQNAIFGANLEPLIGVFMDVEGTTPGLGQNFNEGNTQILTGLRFDYLNKWNGEVRLTTFTGGSDRAARSDRDNVFAFIGYNF